MARFAASQFDLAIPLFSELAKQRTAALRGVDSYDAWVATHCLALAYRENHQPEKAIPLLEGLEAPATASPPPIAEKCGRWRPFRSSG